MKLIVLPLPPLEKGGEGFECFFIKAPRGESVNLAIKRGCEKFATPLSYLLNENPFF
jgi:hypothetical protein